MRRPVLFFLFVCALVASVVPVLLHVRAVERCLDAGGVYDYSARICRHGVTSLPVPGWGADADVVSTENALLVLLATVLVATAILSTPLHRFDRLRGWVRWAGAVVLALYSLVALNNAAYSAWLAGGPPTPQPQAWWGQAVRCFWLSVTSILAAAWLLAVLRPPGQASDRQHGGGEVGA